MGMGCCDAQSCRHAADIAGAEVSTYLPSHERVEAVHRQIARMSLPPDTLKKKMQQTGTWPQ